MINLNRFEVMGIKYFMEFTMGDYFEKIFCIVIELKK